MSVGKIWSDLESDPRTEHGLIARRLALPKFKDVFIAVERPSKRRLLQLVVRLGAVRHLADASVTAGLELRTVPSDQSDQVKVQLVLTDDRYRDVFVVLVDDVIQQLANALDDVAAIASLVARLRRWQEFLKTFGWTGLSEEAQRGLYGELWFLQNYAIGICGVQEAVGGWTGPLRTPQDFQLPQCAVEVKVATGKQHQVLAIASERQLDDTGIKSLLVLHLSLDARRGDAATLPGLVEFVRSAASADAVAAETFAQRIFAAGYTTAHESRYRETSYTIREKHFFRVREGFPRIIERDLMPGCGDVRYSVAVSACLQYEVDEDGARRAIGGVD